MNDVLRGVLFSFGGNIAISIGDHLKVYGEQKGLGKKLYHGKTRSKKRSLYPTRVLLALSGYILMLVGQLSNGYALAFAPQTLLACIGSVQFIMNLICSAILMSRSIKTIHIIGTFSIIIGCLVMIFGFSPKTDTSQLTVYALFTNFNSYHYRNYLMVVVLIFLASILCNPHHNNSSSHTHHTSHKSANKTPHMTKKKKRALCCMDPKLISGFFYSFSSAMTGTQSVVLGKTLAIIIRNYAAGTIVIFDPFNLFIVCFIVIVFLSFLITFIYWLHRRTESMVLYDTVFIAPMNQVMWLTFSTVAGGIYFHEFENAYVVQWMALISGMMFNYVGLYYLVPTAEDQPILIINMEKKPLQKLPKKCIETPNMSKNYKKRMIKTPHRDRNEHKPKRKRIKRNENQTNVIVSNKHDGYETDDDECEVSTTESSTDEDYTTDEEEELVINMGDMDGHSEVMPLLNNGTSSTTCTRIHKANGKATWFGLFGAKRR
eukprot:217219_1